MSTQNFIDELTSKDEKNNFVKEIDFESPLKSEITQKLTAFLEKHCKHQKEMILHSFYLYEQTITKYISLLQNKIQNQEISGTNPENSINYLKEKLNTDLQQFSTNNLINNIQTKIYQLDNVQIYQNDSDQIQQQITPKLSNLFNYQVIPTISYCSNIVINQSSKLIMIEQIDYLNVYEFKNEQVYEVSKFYSGHNDYITKIYSMKYRNQFLTYNFGFIQIWSKNIYGNWNCQQELSNINLNECLIVNDARFTNFKFRQCYQILCKNIKMEFIN